MFRPATRIIAAARRSHSAGTRHLKVPARVRRVGMTAKKTTYRGVPNYGHPAGGTGGGRTFVTAAQKRALDRQQLAGEKKKSPSAAAASAAEKQQPASASKSGADTAAAAATGGGAGAGAAVPPSSASSTTAGAGAPKGGGGGGGSSGNAGLLTLGLVAGIVGVGAYQLDKEGKLDPVKAKLGLLVEKEKEVVKDLERRAEKGVERLKHGKDEALHSLEEKAAALTQPLGDKDEQQMEEDVEKAMAIADATDEVPVVLVEQLEEELEDMQEGAEAARVEAEGTGDRVTTERMAAVGFPKGKHPPQPKVKPVEHVKGGHHVSVEDMAPVLASQNASSSSSAQPPATEEEKKEEEAPPVHVPSPTTAIESEMDELSSRVHSRALARVAESHAALRSDLESTFLKDIESLTPEELRVRIVQLVSEMSDNARWEAVRLREFQNSVEKEVGDKYLEILQKQRVELDALAQRKMRELEDALNRQAAQQLRAKDEEVVGLVDAAVKSTSLEAEAKLKSEITSLNEEFDAKFDIEVQNRLAEAKSIHARSLAEKVSELEKLGARLKDLETAADAARAYGADSRDAHRLSAAAIALANALETPGSNPAAEIAALRATAGAGGVIAAALDTIPKGVASGKDAVPTLPELQAAFENRVRKECRRAAMVPAGRATLGAQLFGYAFSALTIPPSPAEASAVALGAAELSPDEEKYQKADFVLARAAGLVQVGDLEGAIDALGRLDGQAAFTVRDWKRDAENRVVMDKVLRAVRVEIALLNEAMGGGGEGGGSADSSA